MPEFSDETRSDKLRSEIFLQKYRVLEGLLEKRYEGRRLSSSSVVIEYIREDDSQPVRVDLDLLREIRNILSHNAGSGGQAVVEPSQEMIDRLDDIIAYVRRPRLAVHYGTPAERICSAHMNERVIHVMRSMQKNGYSHVPVEDRDGVAGVLSIKGVFDYIALNGAHSLDEDTRIADLRDHIRIDSRYLFLPETASLNEVRNAFNRRRERNSRLSAVFITRTGRQQEKLMRMLTPWDVLSDDQKRKGEG